MERAPSLSQDFPDLIATSGPVRLLGVHQVGFSPSGLYRPYRPEQDRTLLATGHAQASPGHAVLCPTMPPALTTDPPWSSLGAPSSSVGRVGSPGVCADRIAWLPQPRLRPGRLPRVLRISPHGEHPTHLGYRPHPIGRAGLSPAREQHCRAHANELLMLSHGAGNCPKPGAPPIAPDLGRRVVETRHRGLVRGGRDFAFPMDPVVVGMVA